MSSAVATALSGVFGYVGKNDTMFGNGYAFAALKADGFAPTDGSITAWGDAYNGGAGAPTKKKGTRLRSRTKWHECEAGGVARGRLAQLLPARPHTMA